MMMVMMMNRCGCLPVAPISRYVYSRTLSPVRLSTLRVSFLHFSHFPHLPLLQANLKEHDLLYLRKCVNLPYSWTYFQAFSHLYFEFKKSKKSFERFETPQKNRKYTMEPIALNRTKSSSARSQLGVLKQIDRRITSIMTSAKHVVLYRFDAKQHKFVVEHVEGPFFVVQTKKGAYDMHILNQLSPVDWKSHISGSMDVERKDSFLFLRKDSTTTCMWFYKDHQCSKSERCVRLAVDYVKNRKRPSIKAFMKALNDSKDLSCTKNDKEEEGKKDVVETSDGIDRAALKRALVDLIENDEIFFETIVEKYKEHLSV